MMIAELAVTFEAAWSVHHRLVPFLLYYTKLDRPLQGIALTRSPYFPKITEHTMAATSAFSINSLFRCCCTPTAHCNKSRDSVSNAKRYCIRQMNGLDCTDVDWK